MSRLRLLLFPALLLFCALAAACDEPEQAVRVDLGRREDVTVKQRAGEITYAYLPQYTHPVSYMRHHRLVEYLERATGLPFRQVFPASFDEHMAMFSQGRIDISYSNPFVYIKIARLSGAKAFARIIEPGNGVFSGQIIARKDNTAIRNIKDCRGKRWIATDPASAGGYLFPLGLFWDNGIHKEDFAEIAFAGGNQERVVMSVYSGLYDLGSIRNGTLDVVAGKIPLSEIRVVAESPPYPNWVYAARGGLAPEVVQRIGEAMAALDPAVPEHREILATAGIERIVPAEDHDFDPVRELIAKLGPAARDQE